MRKTRIFFDMDGTLNRWELGKSLDEVAAPGYMKERVPFKSMVEAARILADAYDVELWIASCILPYDHSIPDKNHWISKYCPFFPEGNRVYIPYGENKRKYLKKYARPGDVFIDDYTKNLYEMTFAAGPMCVKCVNDINDTNHSWNGARISVYSDGNVIAKTIAGLAGIKERRTA